MSYTDSQEEDRDMEPGVSDKLLGPSLQGRKQACAEVVGGKDGN